jgi:hypothetical protein
MVSASFVRSFSLDVWERMRADERADTIGMIALIAFLVVPIALGALFGWVFAALAYAAVFIFAVVVVVTAR